jgi:hypothetical protein
LAEIARDGVKLHPDTVRNIAGYKTGNWLPERILLWGSVAVAVVLGLVFFL